MLAITLAGTDRSDIPRYLLLSGVGPFPFQRGIIMTRFQTVGMIQCFHMSVKRGSSQLIMGLHLNLEALLLRRRFRELGYSSVFGLQFLIDEHQFITGAKYSQKRGIQCLVKSDINLSCETWHPCTNESAPSVMVSANCPTPWSTKLHLGYMR